MEEGLDLLYVMFRKDLCDWFEEILQGEEESSIRLEMLKVGDFERM